MRHPRPRWCKDANSYELKIRFAVAAARCCGGSVLLRKRPGALASLPDVHPPDRNLDEHSFESNELPDWASIPLRGKLSGLGVEAAA